MIIVQKTEKGYDILLEEKSGLEKLNFSESKLVAMMMAVIYAEQYQMHYDLTKI